MNVAKKLTSLSLAAALVLGAGTLVAQGRGHDDHGQDNHGGPGGGHGGPGGGPQHHFQPNDRGRFDSHYHSDAMRWRGRPNRPQFTPGYAIPRNYAIRPVPRSYYYGATPLPPGYQYGYYDGYVVSYNPVTRIIADVLDLAAGN